MAYPTHYDIRLTSHALRCFKEYCDRQDISFNIEHQELFERLAVSLLTMGVKIGGDYIHYKGGVYCVTGLSRDCENWSRWRVEYYKVEDPSHKASRFLEDFLGITEDGKLRFQLVF